MVPGVAPAANQMGRPAAKNLLRTLKGELRKTLHYVNKGNLATIGRNRAVADFGQLRLAGRMAWFLWLFVHILYLVGFRNRMRRIAGPRASSTMRSDTRRCRRPRGHRLPPGPDAPALRT
jgi:NADH dehydrogenase FAD-containing subunit